MENVFDRTIDENLYNKVCSDLMNAYHKKLATEKYYNVQYTRKYIEYIQKEIRKAAVLICDLTVVEIPGCLTRKALEKYRICVGIIKNPLEKPRVGAQVHNTLDTIIENSQAHYYEDQVKVNGPISLDTPANIFYLTIKSRNILRREMRKRGKLIIDFESLDSLVDAHKYATGAAYKELSKLLVACGHLDASTISNESITIPVESKIDSIDDKLKKLYDLRSEIVLASKELALLKKDINNTINAVMKLRRGQNGK